MKKYWILFSAVLTLLGSFYYYARSQETEIPQVELIRIRCEEYTEYYSVSGTVKSPFSRTLSPKYPFVPQKVFVKEGDYVEYGDLLAVIDPEQTIRALSAAAVKYTDLIPEEFFGGNIQRAIAEIQERFYSDSHTDYLELRAPMNGVLTSINLTPGKLYFPSSPAAAVETLHSLRLELDIPEKRAGSLRNGSKITFTAAAVPNGRFQGTITYLRPAAVRKMDGLSFRTVVEADAWIEDDFGVLRPGYTVQAEIPAEKSRFLDLLPYDAVLRDSAGQEYVYVLQDGNAVRRNIETGRQLTSAVEIVKGLGKNEVVIRDASALTGEGPVQLMRKEQN